MKMVNPAFHPETEGVFQAPVKARRILYLKHSSGLVRILFFLATVSMMCCDSSSALQIDGTRVLDHVREIVRYGPHPPGSPAQAKVAAYIEDQLKSYGLQVQSQEFTPVTPLGRMRMKNVWGVKPGARDSVIVLASHYDSKYFEQENFVGANDGGSSSGLLLELARVLAQKNPTDYTLWFVFFDGEEAFLDWTNSDSLYGSRTFVSRLSQNGAIGKIKAMILLDLIGGKQLKIQKDYNSTKWLTSIIWEQAARMGYSNIFDPSGGTAVDDDHIPFYNAGVPVVDVIDLSYAYWHRPEDTLDKLSARNLEVVGRVIHSSLAPIAAHLNQK